jgi:hypothetical protein
LIARLIAIFAVGFATALTASVGAFRVEVGFAVGAAGSSDRLCHHCIYGESGSAFFIDHAAESDLGLGFCGKGRSLRR